jgi:ABC-type sulfate transport system substrate-binding protein
MTVRQSSRKTRNSPRNIAAGLFFLLVLALMVFYGVRLLNLNTNTPIELMVYAFSTQEETFTQGIFPAFTRSWEASSGTEVTLTGVFGPSGTLAGQISLGAPADIVIFSSANYLNYLKISRVVDNEVEPLLFGSSPIVIVTRPGNPAGIKGFADLGQQGLTLVHADPRSSGAGEWSLLAEYGSAYLPSLESSSGLKQLREIWRNVRIMAPSARTAMTIYELGAGDALITYEQDARLAQDRGVPLEIITPSPTLLSQPVAVAVQDNISRTERAAVQAFLDFLVSPEAQAIFARHHMRPVDGELPGVFDPITSFSCEDLGGWTEVYANTIKPYWQDEILPHLSLDDESSFITPGK